MANAAWPKEKINQLIDLLRDAPALWDIKSKEFQNRERKFEEMHNIATRLNVSEDEVAKKIKSIKTQYRREYTKQLQHEKNGLSSSRDKEWFGYKPLSFLRKNISSKEVDSPAQDNSGEDESEDKEDADSSDSSSEEEISVVCPTKPACLKNGIKKNGIPSPESNSQNLKRKIGIELFDNPTPKRSSPPRVQKIKNPRKDDLEIHGTPPRVQKIKNQQMDDLEIYGKNVASRMRNSMQGYREMAIARHEIDKILFRLEMGEFR